MCRLIISLVIMWIICKIWRPSLSLFFAVCLTHQQGYTELWSDLHSTVFPFNECIEVNIYTNISVLCFIWQWGFYFEREHPDYFTKSQRKNVTFHFTTFVWHTETWKCGSAAESISRFIDWLKIINYFDNCSSYFM